MKRALVYGTLLTATLLLTSGALAQTKPQPPPAAAPDDAKKQEARALFERGVAHMAEEAWDVALAEFLRSREIYPTKSATRNVVVCLRKLKRYDEALEMLDVLVHDFPDLNAEDREFVDRSTTELKGFIGFIELSGAAPGSTVTTDGRDRGEVKPGSKIRVGAGSRVVRVSKAGFTPFEKRITVTGEQTLPIVVWMDPLQGSSRPEPVVAPPTPAAPAADTSMPTQKVAGIAVGAVGLVGVGIGAVFGVRAMGLKSDSDADGHCVGDLCDPTGTEIRNDSRSSGTISTIAFIAGGVAVAGGVVLFVTAPSSKRVETSLALVPGGVSFRGAW